MELPTLSTAYLWFDTEYSSLDLGKAHLLQVALVITDAALNRVTPPSGDVNLCLRIPEGVEVSPWVHETMPDLIRRCQAPDAVTPEEADRQLAAAVDRFTVVPLGDEKKRPILAGNSVHSDWYLLLKYLPQFKARLHYRHLDVTAFKLQWQDHAHGDKFEKDDVKVVQKFFPGLALNADSKLHDAYYDCQASIAELAFYRKRLLKRSPVAAA